MLCPRCYGKHVIQVRGAWAPCPECGGAGALHCCDGLRDPGECGPESRAADPKAPDRTTSATSAR